VVRNHLLLYINIERYIQPTTDKIMDKRVLNEIKILNASKYRNNFQYNDIKGTFVFDYDMRIANKDGSEFESWEYPNGYKFKILIDTKDSFPFYAPKVRFSCELDHLSFDVNKLNFEEIMQENWHPSLRIIDSIERIEHFIMPLIASQFEQEPVICPITTLFTKVKSSISVKMVIIFTAIFIRVISNAFYFQKTFTNHFNTIVHTMEHPIMEWYDHGDGHEFESYPPLYGYIYYLIGILQSLVVDSSHGELASGQLGHNIENTLDFKIHNYI
jgi:ubiquitin-protein ligase